MSFAEKQANCPPKWRSVLLLGLLVGSSNGLLSAQICEREPIQAVAHCRNSGHHCLFDDSFAMDFINYGDKIIYCAMYLYVGYINEATNFAESQGGGGSDAKDWGRDKDEDEIEWIRRCLRQATRMVKPRKGKGLSR